MSCDGWKKAESTRKGVVGYLRPQLKGQRRSGMTDSSWKVSGPSICVWYNPERNPRTSSKVDKKDVRGLSHIHVLSLSNRKFRDIADVRQSQTRLWIANIVSAVDRTVIKRRSLKSVEKEYWKRDEKSKSAHPLQKEPRPCSLGTLTFASKRGDIEKDLRHDG